MRFLEKRALGPFRAKFEQCGLRSARSQPVAMQRDFSPAGQRTNRREGNILKSPKPPKIAMSYWTHNVTNMNTHMHRHLTALFGDHTNIASQLHHRHWQAQQVAALRSIQEQTATGPMEITWTPRRPYSIRIKTSATKFEEEESLATATSNVFLSILMRHHYHSYVVP